MAPAFANIGATCLLTHGVQFFTAHQVLQIFVVFTFGRAHSQPFRTALWNDGRHNCFPRLFVLVKLPGSIQA